MQTPTRTVDRHQAEAFAATLPPLLVAAERVAVTIAQGVHGRRQVGQGETFWQYRRYEHGDQPNRIDWRRSALSDQVFVRETEWEAAQSVWLWHDASASMGYASKAELPTKASRAALLTIALMALLIRGGERIALLGNDSPPTTGRAALNRLADTIIRRFARPGEVTPGEPTPSDPTPSERSNASDESLPPLTPLPRHAAVVLLGDFLAQPEDIERAIRAISGRGVRGHLVQVLDPAEIEMPFNGRNRFLGLEAEGDLLVGRPSICASPIWTGWPSSRPSSPTLRVSPAGLMPSIAPTTRRNRRFLRCTWR